MTVKEFRDRLDEYIKKDPPDLWQLNDIEADAKAYVERCKERENREIIILDDSLQIKCFAIERVFGYPLEKEISQGVFEKQDVLAICADLTKTIN